MQSAVGDLPDWEHPVWEQSSVSIWESSQSIPLGAPPRKTGIVGKWHLVDELEFLPTNQGFDSYYGIPYLRTAKGGTKTPP